MFKVECVVRLFEQLRVLEGKSTVISENIYKNVYLKNLLTISFMFLILIGLQNGFWLLKNMC